MSRKVKDLKKKKEEWDLAQKLWAGCEMKDNDKKKTRRKSLENKENVESQTNRRRSSRLKQT